MIHPLLYCYARLVQPQDGTKGGTVMVNLKSAGGMPTPPFPVVAPGDDVEKKKRPNGSKDAMRPLVKPRVGERGWYVKSGESLKLHPHSRFLFFGKKASPGHHHPPPNNDRSILLLPTTHLLPSSCYPFHTQTFTRQAGGEAFLGEGCDAHRHWLACDVERGWIRDERIKCLCS